LVPAESITHDELDTVCPFGSDGLMKLALFAVTRCLDRLRSVFSDITGIVWADTLPLQLCSCRWGRDPCVWCTPLYFFIGKVQLILPQLQTFTD